MTSEEANAEVPPNVVFAVGDRPHCLWSGELERFNRQFCESLDPDWFVQMVERLVQLPESESGEEFSRSSASGIRLTYHHAAETFFALIFAAFQAPKFMPAWLELYTPAELRGLVAEVGSGKELYNAWGMPTPTWTNLSKLFHSHAWPDSDRDTAGEFAALWKRLARDWLEDAERREYNATKHGLRALPGGFFLRVGEETQVGVPAPPESMKSLGGSRYGSRIFTVGAVGDGQNPRFALHLGVRTSSINWSVEETVGKVQLLSMSMKNVLSAVRIATGTPGAQVQFHRAEDPDTYMLPWSRHIGVTKSTITIGWPDQAVLEIAEAQVVDVLRNMSGLTPSEEAGGASREASSQPDVSPPASPASPPRA